jgi:hypothetical protein
MDQEKPQDEFTLGLGQDAQSNPKVEEKEDDKEGTESEQALVKEWAKKIRKAKARWEDDFERMRKNMEFVWGLQWQSQEKMDTHQYVANLTLRSINQKVATRGTQR